ncbi:MAG: hydrogenase maturation factor, partial [Roseburia sp. 40_7]
MKVGKLPENVLKRSVLKQIHTKRPEVCQGAAVGEDCAAICLAEDEMLVLSTDPITGTAIDIGSLSIAVTLNDLASAGAEPVGVMLTALLPEDITEQQIRQMMQQAENACERSNVEIIGGHTEVTKAVNVPVITVTGVGKVKKDAMVRTSGAKPGMDIVMSKWAGLEGTAILAKEKREELLNRFSENFIFRAQKFDQMLSVIPEAATAVKSGVGAMHDVTEGGIFGALWELAEASGVGLEIELKKIPLKQETVEICEFFGINPYELISSGVMLMAAKDGNRLVMELAKENISACV